MIHAYDLAALGLLPPPGPPRVAWPLPAPYPLGPALAACDAAGAMWAAWIAAARVWPMAWLAVLDAAERAGRCR